MKLKTQNSHILYNECIVTNSMGLVREQTIPTERPQLVDEVSANF
jgi:hypothetical protein